MGSKELRSVSPLLRRIRFCFKKTSIASNELAQADKAARVWLIAVYLDLGLDWKSSLPWPHVEITAAYEYCIMGQVDDAPPRYMDIMGHGPG